MRQPPTEQDLILFYYGESDDAEAIERALDASPELAQRYRELRRVLDAIPEPEVPEPSADYAERVWRRLEPRIVGDERRTRTWGAWLQNLRIRPLDRRWVLAAAALLLAVVAFLTGRATSPPSIEGPQTAAVDVRERILLVTVADHLERSEMLLLELANSEALGENADGGPFDLSAERRLAGRLSGDNRIYRQAAERAGEARLVRLLDELERTLLQLAHAPDELASDELDELRRRLEEHGLLFRVKVVGSRLRREAGPGRAEAEPAPVSEPGEPTREI